MKKIIFTLLTLVGFTSWSQVTIGLKDGKLIEGQEIGEKTGRITITISGGATRTLDKNDIKYIDCPQPKYISSLIKYTNAGKYDAVLKTEKNLKEVSLFGWGQIGHLYYSRALLAKGKVEDARKMLRRARFSAVNTSNKLLDDTIIMAALIDIEVHDKKLAAAEDYIKKISEKQFDSNGQKYYFMAKGNYYRAKGDANQALASYFKVILLESPKDFERKRALEKVKEIYTEFNDPRLAELNKL
ncbi:hypothetical protein LNTAR_05899 [Lentisphaera araneosa HTCC2155]|uniref:Tetratricopeptide repeat protein n=1 Tax=Lentisphaera araneosa HTCC2155 TaxID=313628 RepID=A6DPI8_9BACT|nr:hypothetical protein [Lentisphaera araneosa]EDM26484.1 hypothetical protein LNTAR_05899 [Lentisphaera araneosa HTCC2155]